jgi:hypothetical protein
MKNVVRAHGATDQIRYGIGAVGASARRRSRTVVRMAYNVATSNPVSDSYSVGANK